MSLGDLHLDIKKIIGVVLLVIVLREWRGGYFRGVKAYLGSLPVVSYGKAVALLLAVVIAAFFADSMVRTTMERDYAGARFAIETFGRHFGRNLWSYLGGLYLAGLAFRRPAWCRMVFGMTLATALTGLTAAIMKWIFLRARPDMGLGPLSFFHLEGILKDNNSFQSFPSGDVAIVAGAASYVFYALRGARWRWICFALPLTTAYSRISLHDHWLSDTLCALALSMIFAHIVWNFKRPPVRRPSE